MAGNSPYINHDVEKQAGIGELAVKLLDYDTVLPNLFVREGYEKWKGQEGDTLTYRVPGRLPYRKRQFRDPRTTPLIFDVYKESKTTLTWGGRIYSGAEVTDEQQDFDLRNWEPVIGAQIAAVSQGVNDDMAATVDTAPYEVTVGKAVQNLKGAIIEARRVLNRFRVPGRRLLIVGTDFESELLNNDRITLALNVGDSIAEGALREANLGRLSGFDIYVDPTINPEVAYACVDQGFVQTSGAPGVPLSVKAGTSISLDSGTAARWIMDYDFDYQKDRSTVDCYVASAPVKDLFLPKSVLETGSTPVSFDPSTLRSYFVRGIKLSLDGNSVYPTAATHPDLVAETGISLADAAWVVKHPNVVVP